ncbi:MAG: nucleoside monophosphate kinase [Candidatus Liptonbacteria bacterium]|nr:nucleoside monophosphate kinase [Candidatus Liptonbacteria bacterium]
MKQSKIFNLILLGDPSAGKATQARRLLKEYPLLQEFDFGGWLRSLKSARARSAFKFGETSGKGMLTPTHLARAKFKEVIFNTPKKRGVFFNGNPKMLGEAKLVYRWFREAGRTDPLAIYLSIPRKEMLKRVGIRARIEKRSDDEMEHLKNRMKYYAKNIPAVVVFLKSHYRFKKVSGIGTREKVYVRLVSHIEKELARNSCL